MKLIITMFIAVSSLCYSQDFWEQTNGPYAGSINSIATSPTGDIFVGTVKGVFRSTDNGNKWISRNNGLRNLDIEFLVINSYGDIFLGVESMRKEIFRSTDNGDNWISIHSGYCLVVYSGGEGGVVLAGSYNGVHRSIDNGNSWNENEALNRDVISLAINSNRDIFAGTWRTGLFRSTDSGENWTQINNGLANRRVECLTINSNGDIFAGTRLGLFRSTDNGDNWNQILNGLTNLKVNCLAVSFNGTVFAGTDKGVFGSQDNGDSWIQLNYGLSNYTVNCLNINLNGDVFAGTDDGMFRSIFTVLPPHSASLTLNKKYIQTEGDTLSISAQLVNPEDHILKVYTKINSDEKNFQDSFELFDDGQHGDGEASDNLWGAAKWLSGLEEDNYKVDLSISDLTTGESYLQPFYSRFTTQGPVVFENYNITTSYTIPNIGERIKISLSLRNEGITDTVYDIEVNLISPENLFISNSTLGTPKFEKIAPGSIAKSSRDYGIIFGDSCSPGTYEFGLEIKSNDEVFWYDSFIISHEPTSVENNLSTLPKEFALDQNYPNPFNPSTTIKYSLPVISWQSSVGSQKQKKSQSTNHPIYPGEVKRSRINQSNGGLVSLKIYDVLGKEVATLVNQQQRPGSYEVKWDASGLTSGVYFYKLSAGHFIETKKMILLR